MSDGHIEQTNFDSYTPVSMKAVPEIDVSIISDGTRRSAAGNRP
jgi:CO/xanthine dehydrogenase Mo-binding subunit